jgi:hypothetical protein
LPQQAILGFKISNRNYPQALILIIASNKSTVARSCFFALAGVFVSLLLARDGIRMVFHSDTGIQSALERTASFRMKSNYFQQCVFLLLYIMLTAKIRFCNT